MKYQRLTKQEKVIAVTTEKPIYDNVPTYEELYERLAELEDRIEEGRIVERDELETEFANKEVVNKLSEETAKLKMQLKSQPSEIVEKIRKQIFNHFDINNMEEYESLSMLDSLFTADVVTEMLDTILKEYQDL